MGTNPACTSKTSGCRVRAYKHGIGSNGHSVGQNDPNECRKDANNCCVHWEGISSYEVLDCPENVVPVGHYRGNGYAMPMGSGGPLGHALALSGTAGGLPPGWNDHIQGISFHTTPSANANQISYDIPTAGLYTIHQSEIALPKQGISADRDDVILGSGKDSTSANNANRRSRPCPGGTGNFLQGARKVRCLYSKTDDAGLRNLHTNKNGIQNDPRASMHANLKEQFCGISENWTKNPGGGTCMEWDSGKRIAEQYCSVGNRIAVDNSCTKVNLGDTIHTKLAENYCKTAAGKTDAWCSCYNVIKGVCDTDSTAAGCAKKRQTFDKLVEATPEEYKNSWSQMEPCFGGVCQGNVFQPAGYNSNCNRSVQVCVQDFDFQSMADSQINATCNLTSNRDTQPSAGDGSGTPSYTPSGAPSGTTYPTGSTAATLDTSFRSKLPEFLRPYVPVSIDEVKTDSSKQLGVGGVGSLFMMCCCLLVIIVLATSGGGESGGRSMRFRR